MKRDPKRQDRGASRFPAGIPAVVRWDDDEFTCEAENLSRSGAMLTGNLPEAGPHRIEVDFTSGAGDLNVTLSARVSRASFDDEGRQVRLAVEFEDVSDADREVFEMLISRVIEGVAPAALTSLPADASPQQLRAALESVPVAHRASLAARGTPREREVLLKDPDPLVLDGFARNPGLTPPEVRTLLRVRNLLPRTMQMMARDSRWISAEEFKILIACHPNTPYSLAERLVDTLSPAGREKAIRQPGLKPAIRLQIGRKSGKRG